ncbi:MAG: hypothetical protein HC913_17675 [Microscillaceae bacterium]|nr:hypothetical protein [Microscillaceae bacterium]
MPAPSEEMPAPLPEAWKYAYVRWKPAFMRWAKKQAEFYSPGEVYQQAFLAYVWPVRADLLRAQAEVVPPELLAIAQAMESQNLEGGHSGLSQLDAWDFEMEISGKAEKRRWRAGGLLGLFIFTAGAWALYGVFFTPRKLDFEALFRAHYQPFPSEMQLPPTRPDSTKLLGLIQWAYLQNQTRECLRLCQQYEARHYPNDTLDFYQGMSYLALQKPQPALEKLLTLSHSPNSHFTHVARWYAALAYLKLQNPGAARTLLEHLRLQKGPYRQKAENLARRLP